MGEAARLYIRNNVMESFPIWCDGCDQQGKIFVDNFDQPTFVVCNTCGFETSQVWCPKCKMGGEYVRNIETRPKSWVCIDCHTEYVLPKDFYNNPTNLRVLKSQGSNQTKSIPSYKQDALIWIVSGLIFFCSGLFIAFGDFFIPGIALMSVGVLFFILVLKP